MTDIAALSVKVTADTSEAESGLARLNSQVSGAGSAIASAFGGAAIAGVAALGAGLVGSIKSAADFEKQMSAIGAVAGATTGEMKQLSDLTLQLGKDTSFSATEAAKGVEELIKAGVSIETVAGGAGRAVLDLAAASGTAVDESARIMSNAMNVFKESGLTAEQAANILAGASNASATSVHELGYAMAASGGVASMLGFTFEETATALSMFADAGLRGSDAGTSFKTMMMNLIPQTNKEKDLMRDLGLVTSDVGRGLEGAAKLGLQPMTQDMAGLSEAMRIHLGLSEDSSKWTKDNRAEWEKLSSQIGLTKNEFFKADGTIKPLGEVFDTLKNSLVGMTKEQQISAIMTIFGTDATRAAAIANKMGSEGVAAMTEKMRKQGDVQKIAEERLNNLAGSWEKFTGSIETGAIILGSLFLPALRGMVDGMTDFANQSIGILEQLPAAWTGLMQAFDDGGRIGADSLAGFTAVFGAWGTTVQDVARQAGDAWRTAMSIFSGEEWHPADIVDPFVNAIGTIALVVRDQVLPAMQQLGDAFNFATDFLAAHLEIIAGVVAAWATFTIIATVAGWVTAAIAAWGALSAGIAAAGGVIAAIVAIMGGPLTLIILAIAAIVGVLTAAWIGNWGDIQGKTAAVVAWLGTALTEVGAFLTELGAEAVILWQMIVEAWDGIVASTTAAWTAVVTGITAAWTTITTTVQAGWDGLVAIFTAGIALVQGIWDAGWALLQSVATAAWNLLSTENQVKVTELVALITLLWQLLPAIWTAGTALVTTTVTTWWAAIVALWTTTTTTITTTTTTWWTTISGLWTTWTTTITATATTWWTAMTALWTTVTTALATLITMWWTTISAAWTAGMTAITALIAPWWASIQAIWAAAHAAIVAGVNAFFTLVSDAWTTATTTLSGLAASLGTAIMDALLGALNAGAAAVVDSVIGTVRKAIEGAKSLLGTFGASGGGSSGGQLMSLTGGGKASQYASLISQVSGETGVPADVLAGLIDTENSGERSTSPAGAKGIMQVMPMHYQSGEDPFDPLTSIRQGARVIQGNYARSGDWNTAAGDYFGHGTDAGGMTTGNYTNLFSQNRAKYSVAVPKGVPGMGDITMTQAQWGAQVGMTPKEAAAACGPYAAFLFAQATGRTPNASEAEQLARLSGWTEAGMGGTGNFMDLLGREGVNAVRTNTSGMSSTDITTMAANAGPLTAFSTPGHYFASTGFDPATQKFNVGATGTFAGGSTMMSVDEMVALEGPIQDVISLAGQMGPAFQAAGAQAGAGLVQISTGAVTAGTAIVTASTDSLGNMTQIYSDATGVIGATVTNAAGVIVNAWGTMATGTVAQTAVMTTDVVANTNLMATGALTSVTSLGTGVLTTVQTMSGSTIATVTDMSGQVTSQYATLANGAVLTMGDMAAGILTSTTDLGTGVMTTVQDMSGNYITTITDLSGNVTAQYTQLAADAIAQTVVQSEGVQAETTAMSEAVLTSVTDLGEGVLTITTDMSGQTIATITDMAGNVTSTYSSMGSDVTGIAQDAASAVVEVFQQAGDDVTSAAEDMASSVTDAYGQMEDVPQINMSDTVSQFKKASEAAKAYTKALVAAAKASEDLKGSGGGKKGGSKELAKGAGGFGDFEGKAIGGPVSFGQEYLVGEHGPEMFVPNANGTIITNERLRAPAMSSGGGGGGVSTHVFVIQDPAGRTLEEWYVKGRDLAIRRGRD